MWRSLRMARILLALTVMVAAVFGSNLVSQASSAPAGMVYTATNAADGNAILIYARAADGTLTPAGQVATGGLGTGGGLGNQGAVVLSKNQHWLLTVNAGSNTISAFRVRNRELTLVSTVPSGGERPVSISIDHRLVYVLNAGGAGNISGFTIDQNDQLVALPNSTRPLSGSNTGPAQVSFAPDGRVLVVTEKATNLITTYSIDQAGYAGMPNPQPSAGQTPFGFGFDKRGRLIVSEAFGGAAGAGVVSSYNLDRWGQIEVISAAVPDHQSAPCWIVVTEDGRYTYTTNAASNNVSGYAIGNTGDLTLLGDGVTGATGAGPIDAALSRGSEYLYTLNARDGTLSAFRINGDGSLSSIAGVSGIPAGANGLAAR